jgi:hypothetical protein
MQSFCAAGKFFEVEPERHQIAVQAHLNGFGRQIGG